MVAHHAETTQVASEYCSVSYHQETPNHKGGTVLHVKECKKPDAEDPKTRKTPQ